MNRRVGTLIVFATLAVAHTWPLALAPATLSRNDNADTVLNEWILAWVSHQAPRDPLHLFDANIFYPERNTLAFSEHLFVPAMAAAPVLWLGGSPVLAYNLLLIAGFALTGWAMSLLIEKWTGDWIAGIGAGCLMAFNAHTLTRLPHIQAIHVEFLPLLLLVFDRLLTRPTRRGGLALGVLFALQALTSNYLLVFTLLVLVVALLVRPSVWAGRQVERIAWPLCLAAAVAFAAVTPFLLPYFEVSRDQGLSRSLAEVGLYSATWRDYLATAARIHFAGWSHHFFEGATALFPGVVGTGLTIVAVGSGAAFVDARARMCLAFGVAGLLLSFGPALPGYSALYHAIPLLQGIRGAARFGYLTLVSVAALSGFAVAFLRRRWAGARWVVPLSFILLAAINAEALRAPLTYTPFSRIPAIYDRVPAAPGVVLAEFPLYGPSLVSRNAAYMLASTRHWQPLLNGYSGFTPQSYISHYDAVRDFPGPVALANLRAAGVSHVMVHLAALADYRGSGAVRGLDQAADLLLIAEDGDLRLYRLRRP